MSQSTILNVFESHEFLKQLSEPLRMLLASGVQPFVAKPGEVLGREGHPSNKFYLIQSGEVSIGTHTAAKGWVEIQRVGPGETVGWSWLVPPHQWQFDCIAHDEVKGIMIDGEWLRNQCECNHELGNQFLRQLLKVLSDRLVATRKKLVNLIS